MCKLRCCRCFNLLCDCYNFYDSIRFNRVRIPVFFFCIIQIQIENVWRETQNKQYMRCFHSVKIYRHPLLMLIIIANISNLIWKEKEKNTAQGYKRKYIISIYYVHLEPCQIPSVNLLRNLKYSISIHQW